MSAMGRPSPRRERPRSIYATVQRTSTNTPFLYLKPVVYSLTDGTSIPPPTTIPDEMEELRELGVLAKQKTPPSIRLSRRKRKLNKYSPFPAPASYAKQSIFTNTNIPTSPSLTAGPLGSHPMSPSITPSKGANPTSYFSGSVVGSVPSTSSSSSLPSLPSLGGFSSVASTIEEEDEDEYYDEVEELVEEGDDSHGNFRRQTWATNRATIGGNRLSTMYEWQAQLAAIGEVNDDEDLPSKPSSGRNQQHRPGLLARFLKPRSNSQERKTENAGLGLGTGPRAYTFEGEARLRSWNDVAVQNARSGLRAKHATSLDAGLALAAERGLTMDSQSGEDEKRKTYVSSTFPTLVRQKSQNLLNAAKRVSGTWWYGEDDEVVEPIAVDDEMMEDVRSSQNSMEERPHTMIWDPVLDPAPMLPDLEDLGADLTGGKLRDVERLIARIGREEEELSKRRSMVDGGKRASIMGAVKRMSTISSARKRWSTMMA